MTLTQRGKFFHIVDSASARSSGAGVFGVGQKVPDEDVIGDVNRGWYVAMATTSSERGLTLRSPGRFLATTSRLVQLYRKQASSGSVDPALRARVAQAWILSLIPIPEPTTPLYLSYPLLSFTHKYTPPNPSNRR